MKAKLLVALLAATALPISPVLAQDAQKQIERYRELLAQEYEDFVQSTPAREKVFKVFQDADGTQHVQLASLRDSLADRRIQRAA